MDSQKPQINFSLTDEGFQKNPPAVMAELRNYCPVHHTEVPVPHYTLTRAEDVIPSLRDEKTWSSLYGPGLAFGKPGDGVLVSSDPPEHTRERLAIASIFKPSVINSMEKDIRKLTNNLLDEFGNRTQCDLIENYAMPIPLTVMCWLLGTPISDIEKFRRWVLPMAEAVSYPGGREASEETKQAYSEFFAYFGNHIADRTAQIEETQEVPDDLLSRLLTVERDGQRLTGKEVLGFCQFLLVAGSETTTLLIGNVIFRLLEFPEQMEKLLEDNDLLSNAIEESLRYDAPVHGLFRTNTCPVTLHDVYIPTDSKVYMMFGAANRDPELWEEADEFNISRDITDLKKHAAFGVGTHYCLGAPLARLEATIALETIITRLPSLRLNGTPKGVKAGVLKGFEELPVCWDL
jgi:cytochrome P450